MLRASNPIFSLLSILAVAISAATLYLAELRRAEIDVLISDVAYLGRDPNGSAEIVLAPITIVNTGAREGVLRDIALTVERLDETGAVVAERAFFAAHIGVAPGRGAEPFTPIAALRQTALSSPVLFYPVRPGPPVIDAAGRYRLTARYEIESGRSPLDAILPGDSATSAHTQSYEVRLPYFSAPELVDGGMIRMTPTGWTNGQEE